MKTAKTVFQKINAPFETAPTVEPNSNVFTVQDYCAALGISEMTARRRIDELLRRTEVRKVKVKSERGLLTPAFEYVGGD